MKPIRRNESSLRGAARELSVIAGYLALTIIATYPLVTSFRSAVPPGGDSWLYYWNLWWVKRALLDLRVSPLFTPELYFPYGATLYFHTLNLFQSVMALPLTATAGLAAAYNFVVFVAFTFSGYAMYRLALYVLAHEIDPAGVSADPSRARLAAFVAGVAFAFSGYRFAHLHGHLDLISTQWLPLFVLFLLKSRDVPDWKNPVICGVILTIVMLTSAYYVMFLLVFTGLFGFHTILMRRRDAFAAVARLAFAIGVFVLVASPVLIPMLVLGRTAGRSLDPSGDTIRFSADVLAFLVPSPLHPVWGRSVTVLYQTIFGRSAGYEHVAFLGYVPLLLAGVGVARYKAVTTLWLVTLPAFLLLALGPIAHLHGQALPMSSVMPYRLISSLPFGDIPRVPVRFVVMAQLILSVLAGCGAWCVLRARTTRRASMWAAAVGFLMLFENAAVPLRVVPAAVPRYFDRLSHEPTHNALLEVPIPDDPAVFPSRMLFQTVHGKPIYQGYLARIPPSLPFDTMPGFRHFKALSLTIDDVETYDASQVPAISRSVLAAFGASHVVIEKRLMRDDALVERARDIGDALLGISSREYEDEETLAYAIRPGPEIGPSAVWLDTGWSYLERLDQQDAAGRTLRWRWMGDRSRIAVLTNGSANVRLKMTASAFNRSRGLKVSLFDTGVATLQIGVERADYETGVFRVPAGVTYIDFTSLERAESPGVDRRRLSVALFNIQLIEQP